MAERGAPLDKLSGIEALFCRVSRVEDFPAENRALANLAHELAATLAMHCKDWLRLRLSFAGLILLASVFSGLTAAAAIQLSEFWPAA